MKKNARDIRRRTYTPAEIGAMLHWSLSTVYRRIEDGQLSSLPREDGQAVRIPIEEFHQKFPGLRPLFQLSFEFFKPANGDR